jgi:hypothetical protein
MRFFFKWLWRFNAILIAGAGILLVLALFAYWMNFGSFEPEEWNPDQRATVVAGGGSDDFSVQLVDDASTPEKVLAALVGDGRRRYSGSVEVPGKVMRNLIVFDRATGAASRVFEGDSGEVGRMVSVDAQCNPIREHNSHLLGAGMTVVGALESQSQPLPARPTAAAMVALWGLPDEQTWRFGVVGMADGAWREVARDVERFEDLQAAPNGRCLAIVRRDGQLHSVDFGLGADLAVRDQVLILD